MNDLNPIDGYNLFFDYFNDITHQRMIKFGLDNLITAELNDAKTEWNSLKSRLVSNETVYIRGYGREAKGTDLFKDLYKLVFNNENILKDKTNNQKPTALIEGLTKHSKKPTKKQLSDGYKYIQNFQVSHVFGKTKNPLLFTAPWNIVILPKIMDPFTGHESKGELTFRFTNELQSFIYDKYKELIKDYNSFVSDELLSKIENSIDKIIAKENLHQSKFSKFKQDALSEWEKIQL
jgi:hypothetical protein